MKILIFTFLFLLTVAAYSSQGDTTYRCDWLSGDYVLLHAKDDKTRFLVTPDYVVDLGGEAPELHDYYMSAPIHPMPLQQTKSFSRSRNNIAATVTHTDQAVEPITCQKVQIN